MTTLQHLTRAGTEAMTLLGITGEAIAAFPPEGASFDNRPSWDNVGPTFDNRPSWDNWSNR